MTLTELSINRPSFIVVIFSILIGGGLICYKSLNYELLPDFSPPLLAITTTYPGASPSTVESQVSKPLEDALSSLENVQEVTSFSNENYSIVLLEFSQSTDIDKMSQEAQRKLENIQNLPDDAGDPAISKIEPNAAPVLQVSVTSSKLNDRDFRELLDNEMLPAIKQVPGVAAVQIIGGVQREVRVNLNQEKLKAYRLPITVISQAIAGANLEFPTGKVKSAEEQLSVRLAGKIQTVDELRELVVFNNNGSQVKLKDVAEVEDGIKDVSSVSRINGKNGIGMRIQKQSDANAVDMSNKTLERFRLLEEKHKKQGVEFKIASDTSRATVESVDAVLHDLEIAIILVALVMLLFLHSLRNAFIVLISIPASLISTFIVMYALGYSLNLMTLLAMSLVIGILVDDSIVVLENIYRHLQMGKEPRKAALDGRNEIGFTALAITLVDVVVFSPLLFVEGVISDILSQFSVVVVVSTLMSLFVCFTLTPWLASRFSKLTVLNPKNPFQWVLIWFERRVTAFTEGYVSLVAWVLRSWWQKIMVVIAIIGMFVMVGVVMSLGIVGQEFVAQGDSGKFLVKLRYEKSVPLKVNNAKTLEIENYILAQKEVETVFANVGGPSAGMGASAFGSESRSELTVKLKPGEQLKIPTEQYMTELRAEIEKKYAGIQVGTVNLGLVDSEEAPIELFISGDNMTEVMTQARRLKAKILTIDGAKDPKISTDDLAPEVRIDLDREKMGQLGISVQVLAGFLNNSLAGNDNSKFNVKGTEFDIRVMLDQTDRGSVTDVQNITFPDNKGRMIPLKDFANVYVDNANGSLERKNRRSSTTLRAYVLGTAPGTVAAEIEKYLEKNPLPEDIALNWGGEIKRQKESFGALGTAMGIGLLLVYLILVALYDNYVYPFVVLFSIIVAFIGAFLALNLSSSNLGIFTMLGLIMLLGLVAKNAILIVDFANHLKTSGTNTTDALLESVRERMRPILMTTIAMVVGMVPIAIAKGSGAEWKNGLAWVLIGGLISSLILTIVVVPLMYYVVDWIKFKILKIRGIKIENELKPVRFQIEKLD
jgi:hydrophobic/amphiphilic exporter-1 (mainly G- bacteria), HAE1 family